MALRSALAFQSERHDVARWRHISLRGTTEQCPDRRAMTMLVLLHFALTAGTFEARSGLTNVRGSFERCQQWLFWVIPMTWHHVA